MVTTFFRRSPLMPLSLVVLLMAGVAALISLPQLEDPVITNRFPLVITAWPGASAERVEALVTEPLERVIREVPEVGQIESNSRDGISVIAIELKDNVTDNKRVFSDLRDKLRQVRADMPPAASEPLLDDTRKPIAFTSIYALIWQGEGDAPLDVMKRLAEEFADELRYIPGTDVVKVYGAGSEEIRVELDPTASAAAGLSASEVARALRGADAKVPAGSIQGPNNIGVEVSGELDSIKRVGEVPVRRTLDGHVLRVNDVAHVTRGLRDPPEDAALVGGKRAVYIGAKMLADTRIADWKARADQAYASLGSRLNGDIKPIEFFDQSRYTIDRLLDLSSNLATGALIVVLIILITMGWRAALIVGAALPLVAAGVLFAFSVLGMQLHQMSVFGSIIAIGLLIDNAIVIVDEVRKMLKAGHSRREAAVLAVRHLRVPLLGSTLTTMLAFAPIALAPGPTGEFIGSIAVSVILSLTFSYLFSMSIIPALAARYLKQPKWDGRYAFWAVGVYSRRGTNVLARVFNASIRWPLITLIAVLSLPLAGFARVPDLKIDFFPTADRDQFLVEFHLPGSNALEKTFAMTREADEYIRAQDGVKNAGWLVGGSAPNVYYNSLMNRDNTPSYAQGVIEAESLEAVTRLVPLLQDQLSTRWPEAQVIVKKLGQGPPVDAPVLLRIYADDLYAAQPYVERARRVMLQHPNVIETVAGTLPNKPKLWVDANEDEAKLTGLSLTDIAGQISARLDGLPAGSVLEEREEVPVRVRYPREVSDEARELKHFHLIGSQGQAVPIESLGDIHVSPTLTNISRRNGERMITISGYVTEGALPIEVANEALAAIKAEGELPAGMRYELGGTAEEQDSAVGNLVIFAPVLTVVIAAVLILSFKSFVLAGVLALVAMLSAGIGLLTVFVSGYPFGFNPLIGLFGLIGVALNDGIVVLAAIRANPQAAAGDRRAIAGEMMGVTRHVVSTTLTTAGGFLPLLLFTGGDFWPPLAIVIAGGVGGATLLALFFVPHAYVMALKLAPGLKRVE